MKWYKYGKIDLRPVIVYLIIITAVTYYIRDWMLQQGKLWVLVYMLSGSIFTSFIAILQYIKESLGKLAKRVSKRKI